MNHKEEIEFLSAIANELNACPVSHPVISTAESTIRARCERLSEEGSAKPPVSIKGIPRHFYNHVGDITEQELQNILSPKTNTAMSTDTKQNQVESPKAAKRRRIVEIGENKKKLQAIKDEVVDALSKVDSSNEGGLRVMSRTGASKHLPSPDFMPHKTYLKLYLNEIDEQFVAWEKELDELTA